MSQTQTIKKCSCCGQAGHTRTKCVSAKATLAKTYHHVAFPQNNSWGKVKNLTEEDAYEKLLKGATSLLSAFKDVEDEGQPEMGHPDWDGCYARPRYLYGRSGNEAQPHHQDAINAKAGVKAIVLLGLKGLPSAKSKVEFLEQMERIHRAKMYSGSQAEDKEYEKVEIIAFRA